MTSLIQPGDAWWLWAAMISGVAVCIYLEQNFKWAAKTSGPVLALLIGMALSNSRLLPTGAPAYDVVDDYLVPIAIPLLLFRANVVRIVRESGPMFRAFHVAALGTVIGAFAAGFIFRGMFPRVPEVAGIMTGSYIGGGVNFVAISRSYEVSAELTDDIAADRIATIRQPFSQCGTSVSMKMGKMKSLALISRRVSGSGMASG